MSATTDYFRSAHAGPFDDDLLADNYWLVLHFSSGSERAVRLPDGACRIGGAPDSTIRVAGAGTHCVIFRGPRGVMVRNWSGEATLNGRTFRESPLRFGDHLTVPGCRLRLERERPERLAVAAPRRSHPCREQSAVATPFAGPSQELRLSRPQVQQLLNQLQRAEHRQKWLERQLLDRNGQVDHLRLALTQQRDQHLAERNADVRQHRELLAKVRRRAARRKRTLAMKLRQARSEWQREHEKIQRRLDRYRDLAHRRRQSVTGRQDSANEDPSRQQQVKQQLAEFELQATELRDRAARLEEREADSVLRERDVEARLDDLQRQRQAVEENCEDLRLRTAELAEKSAEQVRQAQVRSVELESWQYELQSQQAALADAHAQLDSDQRQLHQDANDSAEEMSKRLQDMEASLSDAHGEIQQLTDYLSSVLAEKELTASELQAVKGQLESVSQSEQEARASLATVQAEWAQPSDDAANGAPAWEEEQRRLQTELQCGQQALEDAERQLMALQQEMDQLQADSRTTEQSWTQSREDWDQQRAAWQQERGRLEALVDEQQSEISRLQELEVASRGELEHLKSECERLQLLLDQRAAECRRSEMNEVDHEQLREAAAEREQEAAELREQLSRTQADYDEASRRLADVQEELRKATEMQEAFEEKTRAWDARERELTERLETMEQMQLRAENDRTGWEFEWKQLASQYEQRLAYLTAELERLQGASVEVAADDTPPEIDEVEEESDQQATLVGLDLDLLTADDSAECYAHDVDPEPESTGCEAADTASILAKFGLQAEMTEHSQDATDADTSEYQDDERDDLVDEEAAAESEILEAEEENPQTVCDSELQSLISQIRAAAEEDFTNEETPSDTMESQVDDEDDSAEHDESIEVYMQRLLGRKWKETNSQAELQEVAPVDVAENQAVAEDLTNELPREKPTMPPKRPNPLRNTDLSAMRELANESTRHAIMKHARSQRGWQLAVQLATSIIPFLSGVILVILGQSIHQGLMILGGFLLLSSIVISVYQYRAWMGTKSKKTKTQGAPDSESRVEEGQEELCGDEESH